MLVKVKSDGSGLRLTAEQIKWLRTQAGEFIEIKVPGRHRSSQQNRWLWGVAYPYIAEHIGYDRHEHDELHYALIAKCFGTHHNDRLDAEIPNARSSQLSTKEFGDYMEWLVRFAAQEWGVVIPLPGEEP